MSDLISMMNLLPTWLLAAMLLILTTGVVACSIIAALRLRRAEILGNRLGFGDSDPRESKCIQEGRESDAEA